MNIAERNDRTTRTARTLDLAISGADPIDCGDQPRPRRALPDTLIIEWRDGQLSAVKVSGPRLLADGSTSDRREAVSVSPAGFDRLPAWALDVVRRYDQSI